MIPSVDIIQKIINHIKQTEGREPTNYKGWIAALSRKEEHQFKFEMEFPIDYLVYISEFREDFLNDLIEDLKGINIEVTHEPKSIRVFLFKKRIL